MLIPTEGDFICFTEDALRNNFLLRVEAQRRADMLERKDSSDLRTLVKVHFKILTIRPSTSRPKGLSFEIDIPHNKGIRSWIDASLVIVEKKRGS